MVNYSCILKYKLRRDDDSSSSTNLVNSLNAVILVCTSFSGTVNYRKQLNVLLVNGQVLRN